jgi:hypothetical protein
MARKALAKKSASRGVTKTQIAVKLNTELLRQADAKAIRRGVNRTAILSIALAEWLERNR